MIKVDNIKVFNFDGAIRGMRNPLNSWHKSDSFMGCGEVEEFENKCENCEHHCGWYMKSYIIGENDLALMQRLYKGGSEHRKYLRQIFVTMDINAPLYWWKEFDTYKVGTVANSCSTMHKIHSKEFTIDDFSVEHIKDDYVIPLFNGFDVSPKGCFIPILGVLNYAREKFIETNDKDYWWTMIQLLPSSYNQKRTVTMNYENVMAMINQRSNHKLDEWREFVKMLKCLPYVLDIRGER